MHTFGQDAAAVCKTIQNELEKESEGESSQHVKVQRAKAALEQVEVLFFFPKKTMSYYIH